MHSFERRADLSGIELVILMTATLALFVRLVFTPFVATSPLTAGGMEKLSSGGRFHALMLNTQLSITKTTKKPQKKLTASSDQLSSEDNHHFLNALTKNTFALLFQYHIPSPEFEVRPKPP